MCKQNLIYKKKSLSEEDDRGSTRQNYQITLMIDIINFNESTVFNFSYRYLGRNRNIWMNVGKLG